MKARAKDWNKLLGKDVHITSPRHDRFTGSLCGYTTDGSGGISVFRVAFEPAAWADFKAEDVELVTPAGTPWLPLKKGSP